MKPGRHRRYVTQTGITKDGQLGETAQSIFLKRLEFIVPSVTVKCLKSVISARSQ